MSDAGSAVVDTTDDGGPDAPIGQPEAGASPADVPDATTDGEVGREEADGPSEARSADGRDATNGGADATDGAAVACGEALPLRCGDRLNHSTVVQGRANVWTGYNRTARSEAGRETIYVLETSTACQVVARLENLEVDLDLFLMTNCTRWADIQASSTPLDIQTIETLRFSSEAAHPLFVVVDGYAGAAGTYTLQVDCTCE